MTSLQLQGIKTRSELSEEWMFPLMLSFLAGASTCIGAAIVFCFDAKQIERSMTFSLSLAASVMIAVSVISIGPECLENVVVMNDNRHITFDIFLLVERFLSFGSGCFGYWLLSKALAAFPEPESFFANFNNKSAKEISTGTLDEEAQGMKSLLRRASSSESTSSSTSPPSSKQTLSMRRTTGRTNFVDDMDGDQGYVNGTYDSKNDKEEASSKKRSWRVAMLLFFSLLFHNFPEGLAVVASTVESRELGLTVAIGILIHNIPEGIAIAVPCIAARPDMPWLAFWLASGSGLAEPLGAVFALFFLRSSRIPMENVLACVAGIMCAVACLELYPEALRQMPSRPPSGDDTSKKDCSQLIYGTIVGTAIMIATEWYLQ